MTSHRLVNPSQLGTPSGFSHGVLESPGKRLHIAGQTGTGAVRRDLVEQFRKACLAVLSVIEEAGGSAGDLTSMVIYCTDIPAYRARLSEIGVAYRAVFGRHYPAMALIGVAELFEEAAVVELVCTATIPDPAESLG